MYVLAYAAGHTLQYVYVLGDELDGMVETWQSMPGAAEYDAKAPVKIMANMF